MSETRRYRSSAKRATTKQKASEKLLSAAWTAFSTEGLEAASIASIVQASGVSTGSFYNYFGSKERMFDALAEEFAGRIAHATAAARALETSPEDVIRASFRAFFECIIATDGAAGFLARNHHKVRSSLYAYEATRNMLRDLSADISRVSANALAPAEAELVARTVISLGLEAVLQASDAEENDSKRTASLVTTLVLDGLNGLRALNKKT
ncbi:MAG: TetR/AcrR family transcriptional regulator [Pseudomonadota bacterium]